MNAGPTPVKCPACGKRLKIPPTAAGKTVQCPECDEDIPVLKAVPTAVPVPPAAVAEATGPSPFEFDSVISAADTPSTPYFTVIEPRAFTINRKYRVFVRAERRELLALFAGAVSDGMFIVIEDDPSGRKAKRLAVEEAESLDELREAHPFNFRLWFKDIEVAEVVKPSFWFWLNNMSVPQIGLLKLTTAEGNWTLALATVEDIRRLLELLPPLLGDRFESSVVWDKKRRRYVSG